MNIQYLPKVILGYISSFLPLKDRLRFAQTNKKIKKSVDDYCIIRDLNEDEKKDLCPTLTYREILPKLKNFKMSKNIIAKNERLYNTIAFFTADPASSNFHNQFPRTICTSISAALILRSLIAKYRAPRSSSTLVNLTVSGILLFTLNTSLQKMQELQNNTKFEKQDLYIDLPEIILNKFSH